MTSDKGAKATVLSYFKLKWSAKKKGFTSLCISLISSVIYMYEYVYVYS